MSEPGSPGPVTLRWHDDRQLPHRLLAEMTGGHISTTPRPATLTDLLAALQALPTASRLQLMQGLQPWDCDEPECMAPPTSLRCEKHAAESKLTEQIQANEALMAGHRAYMLKAGDEYSKVLAARDAERAKRERLESALEFTAKATLKESALTDAGHPTFTEALFSTARDLGWSAPPPEGPASPVAEGCSHISTDYRGKCFKCGARNTVIELLRDAEDRSHALETAGAALYDQLMLWHGSDDWEPGDEQAASNWLLALRSQPTPTVERQAQAEGYSGSRWIRPTVAAITEELLGMPPDLRSDVLRVMPAEGAKAAEGGGDFPPFGVDPGDSAELEKLRRSIDDADIWPSDATKEAGDYEAAVRHMAHVAKSHNVSVDQIAALKAERAALVELEGPAREIADPDSGPMLYQLSAIRAAVAKLDALRAQPSPTKDSRRSPGGEQEHTDPAPREQLGTVPGQPSPPPRSPEESREASKASSGGAAGANDTNPSGQKEETDHERNSSRGLRRLRGLHGVEELRGQPDAEMGRVAREDSGSVASGDSRGDLNELAAQACPFWENPPQSHAPAKLDGETGPKCGHLMRDGETVLGLCEREPDHDGSHAIVRLLNGPPEEAVRCHKCGKPAEVNDYEGGKGPPACCDCCEPNEPAPAAEVEQATGEAKDDELCYAFGGEPGGPAFQCVALKGHDGPHYLMARAPIPKSFRPAPSPPPTPGGHGPTEDSPTVQLKAVLTKLRELKPGSDAWCRRAEAALGLVVDALARQQGEKP